MLGRMTYLRLILFSMLGAGALSLVSVYCLVGISDVAVSQYRHGYLLYVARRIEKTNDYQPVTKINVSKVPGPESKTKKNSLLEAATEFGVPDPVSGASAKPYKPSLWLVSEKGRILSTNTGAKLPIKWSELPKPKKEHAIRSTDNVLLQPKTFIMKLETTPPTYLISHNQRSLFQGPFLWIQGIHAFMTAAFSVFFALFMTFWYLRIKSRGARAVLSELERGNLKARFEVKRFDEFGNLILDFNRMACEIEKLVNRIKDTESSRSHLLQELGHDVRTPLTSLNTSFETLRDFYGVMDEVDRKELFQMIGADIRYFQDLLDKLTMVATIETPHYKSSYEPIVLDDLLNEELKNRQTSISHLRWSLHKGSDENTIILGDYHLITRLFKNALDNASRYANNAVDVSVSVIAERVEILIQDDGPGLSKEAISSFGKRRERRQVKERDSSNYSLGLGSVIMKGIADVHGGIVEMRNAPNAGACLRISFARN